MQTLSNEQQVILEELLNQYIIGEKTKEEFLTFLPLTLTQEQREQTVREADYGRMEKELENEENAGEKIKQLRKKKKKEELVAIFEKNKVNKYEVELNRKFLKWKDIRTNDFLKVELLEEKEVYDTDTGEKTESMPYYATKTQKGMKVDIHALTEVLMGRYNLVLLNERLYTYSNGVYRRKEKAYIDVIIKDELNPHPRLFSTYVVKEVRKSILSDSRLIIDEEMVDYMTQRFVNFKNGFYDLEERVLIPHNNYIFSRSQLSANFDPDTEEYFFEDYFKTLVPNAESRKTIKQIIGSSYTGKVIKNGHLIIKGESNSGKSVLLEAALNKMIGKEYRGNVSLNLLTKKNSGEYWVQLEGCTANVNTELSGGKAEETAILKAATAGETTEIRELYANPKKFTNTATLVFATNDQISLDETSKAMYNRFNFMLVTKNYKKEDVDEQLLDKIVEFDMDYIATNFLLEFLKAWDNGRKIDVSQEIKEMNNKYAKASNSVLTFVEDICVVAPNIHSLPTSLVELYEEYCRLELGYKAEEKKTLLATLKDRFNVKDGVRYPGLRKMALRGIAIDLNKLKDYDWFEQLDPNLVSRIESPEQHTGTVQKNKR